MNTSTAVNYTSYGAKLDPFVRVTSGYCGHTWDVPAPVTLPSEPGELLFCPECGKAALVGVRRLKYENAPSEGMHVVWSGNGGRIETDPEPEHEERPSMPVEPYPEPVNPPEEEGGPINGDEELKDK